ncbi:MAG: UDP-N-acetylglucosamine 2-epimerase [Planctomycetota bacterium]|nr:UDP-N-acetylglucosamine 2-epimerase [Planctomycetota bacterium]
MTRTVACVVGTRPEAVKLAPIIARLRREGSRIACYVLATGQHRGLLDQALADFDLRPDRNLDLMSPGQSLAELTARALVGLTASLTELAPDLVLAVGDTTTVLAAALASHYLRIPFGHVEAGLRTGEPYRPFPEEKNRELAARLATIHFAPTAAARANLLREGIDPRSIHVTGNTVIDALHMTLRRVGVPPIDLPGSRFLLVTAHRRENWGQPMRNIAAALRDLVERDPTLGLVIPVHPNPEVRQPLFQALEGHPRVRLIEPMRYPEFVATMAASAAILTDSGGVQEEGPALGKSVLVLRPETERPEVLASGGARLVGTERADIVAAVESCLRIAPGPFSPPGSSPYGDGLAAERIARAVAVLLNLDPDISGEAPAPWPPAD